MPSMREFPLEGEVPLSGNPHNFVGDLNQVLTKHHPGRNHLRLCRTVVKHPDSKGDVWTMPVSTPAQLISPSQQARI